MSVPPHVPLGVPLALVAAGVLACGGSNPVGPGRGSGGGGGSASSDTVNLSVTIHGMNGTENAESVLGEIGDAVVARADAQTPFPITCENLQPGADATCAFRIPKGKTVTLYAIEPGDGAEISASDTTTTDFEFVSWAGSCANNSPFGDCQLLNIQQDAQVTVNYRQLHILIVNIVGAGGFVTYVDSDRAALTYGPTAVTNQGNEFTTSAFFNNQVGASTAGIALFTGAMYTVRPVDVDSLYDVTIQPTDARFERWASCQSNAPDPFDVPKDCTVKFPPPSSSIQANFEYWQCADGVQYKDDGRSCSLMKP